MLRSYNVKCLLFCTNRTAGFFDHLADNMLLISFSMAVGGSAAAYRRFSLGFILIQFYHIATNYFSFKAENIFMHFWST